MRQDAVTLRLGGMLGVGVFFRVRQEQLNGTAAGRRLQLPEALANGPDCTLFDPPPSAVTVLPSPGDHGKDLINKRELANDVTFEDFFSV
ncbi:hypothetical protein chiPu_0017684 [Chiloscyllium punctatum]|uniref:Uncharacterized protein n=1 Tax=Chiloscyllium punctatum TaxID=137246 RepID=A0A401RI05_CHIPU|nr:hypothetical protein [Chiloscyllium punctatum]